VVGVAVLLTCGQRRTENETMPALEVLEQRLLLSGGAAESVQATVQVVQALDLYELLGGGKTLREHLDSTIGQVRGLLAAAQGVLNPWEGALLWSHLQDYVATPQPILVNPSSPSAPGARPVYFVNGIQTTRDEAIADAQGLADQLGRPVALIYNPTTGLPGDAERALGDLLWMPPLPQPDPVVREVAGVLLAAWESGQPVDVVGFSEGAASVNDAVRTLDALGLGVWVYDNVSVVLVAAPLGPFDAAGTAHFERLDNVGDPVVELLGDRRLSLLAKLAPPATTLSGLLDVHYFLDSYVGQVVGALGSG
jgi:hypothetical protein